ncbi:fatty acid hydroxylase domain-containing protein 2-like [Daphnia carinata]|uniref:fatty acid hydroxylase domain-containing protein 2-like n=1 Tax=Daphnia carinata TaxID=120202 RepID=UPI00257D0C19|nr:fatty acid hydroxylase domain-containing protein 2-like [Daphnia carinata]XP_057380624.1 fatty acid hydroxylase domain-containing protein 2-like [Daphnia carinata]
MKNEARYPTQFISKSNVQFLALLIALLSVNHVWNLKTIIGIQIQNGWNKIIDRIGDDPFNFYVYSLNISFLIVYWTIGLAYLLMELTAWPKFIFRRKVQPNVVIDKRKIPSLIRLNLFNQMFVMVPCSIIAGYYSLLNKSVPPVREVPTLLRFLADLMILIPTQEIFVYYTHRMFHHRLLYKWTHKWHHDWTTPVALSAMYNHPLEQLIGNVLPGSIGFLLTNSHFCTQWFWHIWSAIRSLNDHSGYRLFAFPSPVRHDFHHQKSTECFAVWGWGPLDYLHGTDKVFRSKIASGELSH